MQTYFRFNSSGTDPDFGTGLNSLDWRGKGQAGEKSVLFVPQKVKNPRATPLLVASAMGMPSRAEFSQHTKKKGGKNSKMAWGIIQLSQKNLREGEDLGGHWRKGKSSVSSQQQREVQHQKIQP